MDLFLDVQDMVYFDSGSIGDQEESKIAKEENEIKKVVGDPSKFSDYLIRKSDWIEALKTR